MRLRELISFKKNIYEKKFKIKIISNLKEYEILEMILLKHCVNDEAVRCNGKIVKIIPKESQNIKYKAFFKFDKKLSKKIKIKNTSDSEIILERIEYREEVNFQDGKCTYYYRYDGYIY